MDHIDYSVGMEYGICDTTNALLISDDAAGNTPSNPLCFDRIIGNSILTVVSVQSNPFSSS